MRHRVAGRHLGRDTAHRRSLYRNLVTDLLRYERLVTTEAKAKEIRPMAEKMITLARRGDLHARRQANRFIYDTHVVKRLFDEIGPRMSDRNGGYTRITKTEPRRGDGASMAVIELVDYWREGAVSTTTRRAPEAATAAATAVAPPLAETTAGQAPPVDAAPGDEESPDTTGETSEDGADDEPAAGVEEPVAEVDSGELATDEDGETSNVEATDESADPGTDAGDAEESDDDDAEAKE